MAVFFERIAILDRNPQRILELTDNYTNGQIHGSADFIKSKAATEDLVKLQKLTARRKPGAQKADCSHVS